MTALRVRLHAELRAWWRTLAALALLSGLAAGLVLAGLAGARRTDTALARLVDATGGDDVYVTTGYFFRNRTLDFARVERLPQVEAAARAAVLAVALEGSGGAILPVRQGIVSVASADGRYLDTIDRPKLVAGRSPQRGSPNEIVADRKALRLLRLGVGDTVRMRMIPRRLLGDDSINLINPGTVPAPSARLRIVGVEARAASDELPGFLYLPAAAHRAHGGSAIGSWQDLLYVRLRHGDADIPAFRTGVERIAGRRDFGINPSSDDRAKVQREIHFQAQALRLASLLGAVVFLLLIGQALLRRVDEESAAYPTLSALGLTRMQLTAVAVCRAGLVAAVAAPLAVVVAVALSPLAPIGRARELEPHPGLDVDGAVLAGGAATIVAALLLIGFAGAAQRVIVMGRRGSLRSGHRPRGAGPADMLARANFPPAVVVGVRMALTRGSGAGSVPVGTTLLGAAMAVAVTVVALTLSGSLSHLFATPRLYGENWDFGQSSTLGGDAWSNSVIQTLNPYSFDDSISAASAGTVATLNVGGRQVGVNAFDDLKGHVPPTVLDGRAPRAADEILLAGKTMDALGLGLGDRVRVLRGARVAPMHVVGRGVLPEGQQTKLGEGAALTLQGLRRVVPGALRTDVHIRVAPGADRKDVLSDLEVRFASPSPTGLADVSDFRGPVSLPSLVVWLSIAFAAGALGHCLLLSVRRRRRDLAVLKALGFVRSQVAAAVAWQATTIAAIALLVGLPLGIAAGRFAWNAFAEDLGVIPEVVIPVRLALLLVPATLVLANLIAAFPGGVAAGTRPAVELRTE